MYLWFDVFCGWNASTRSREATTRSSHTQDVNTPWPQVFFFSILHHPPCDVSVRSLNHFTSGHTSCRTPRGTPWWGRPQEGLQWQGPAKR